MVSKPEKAEASTEGGILYQLEARQYLTLCSTDTLLLSSDLVLLQSLDKNVLWTQYIITTFGD